MKALVKEGAGLRGRVTIRAYRAGTKELVKELSVENLIMTGSLTGRDLIVQWLLGNAVANSIQGGINYIAIGTSNTAAAAADTQLGAETNRAIIAYTQDLTNNEAALQAFFPDAVLSNTTFKEVGAFVNGTASANTGSIFNHAILSPTYTKTAGTDTTVEIDFTFT